MTDALLPAEFADLEPFAATWCLADRARAVGAAPVDQPWTRCRRSTTPASRAPRRPSPTATGSTLDAMPADAERLLQLLHSLALVSYAVEVWRQPLPIDTGSARIDRISEP